ncbi:MAG: penicillin-binding protein 1A [Hyphomicrobiaceae bacterium]
MRPPPILPPVERKPRRKRRSLLLGLLGFAFASGVVLFLAGAAIGGFFLWRASSDLPSYESLAKYEPPVMTRIHAHNGALIAEYAHERRIFVPINTVPKLLIGAYLSAEDKRFFEHNGLDFMGMARAGYRYAMDQIQGRRRRAEGASTITQQVAKNFLLTSERTADRKLKEAILAVRIERAYSKEKILELYLNQIYLGLNTFGVAAASLTYFNKELKDLALEEMAYLAALPKGPNNYHPFRREKEAIARRNAILALMAENGYITDAQAKAASAKPLQVNIRPFGIQTHAADYFAEEVRRTLIAQFGEEKLYQGGLSVRTTLSPHYQALARRALVEGLVAFDRKGGWRGPVEKIAVSGDWGIPLGAIPDVPSDIQPWRLGVVLKVEREKATVGLRPQRQQDGSLVAEREAVEVPYEEVRWANKKPGKPPGVGDVLNVGDVIYVAPKNPDEPQGVWSLMQIPEVGGGIVVMDPHTGRVLASVGGFSFALSQFDRAAQARRQPGSAFKPFVYAAALDNGYKPTSVILDAPITIEQGAGLDVWRPKNYSGQFYGPTTLRVGIEHSRNLMTVRLAQDMGMPLVGEYSRRFGIYDELTPVLSMALGAGETTLLKLTAAYAMLANGGRQVRPTFIDRIQDRWGRAVWRHDDRPCPDCQQAHWNGQPEPELVDDRRQIVDPHTAYQMTSMMEGVVQRGTATSLRSIGKPVAGKTGTTNDAKDAWFIGFSPDLVVGVFIGYDIPKPMGKDATGGYVAAPVFGSFMKMALADKPATPFRIPPGIKLVRVNPSTGLRAQPGDTRSVLEAFKPDEEPDDAYSIIGFTDESGSFVQQPDQEGGGQPAGGWAPRTERSGTGRGEDARALSTRRGLW